MKSSPVIQMLERRLLLSGTPELVLDIETAAPLQHSSPNALSNVNGTLFFAATKFSHGGPLWKSDGTAEGTQIVKEIRPGFSTAVISEITDVNGTAYFSARGPLTYGLWRSDGTGDGTVQVKAFAEAPLGLTNANGTLFFYGDDGVSGYELWKSDGTTAGTVMVKDIVPGSGDSGPSAVVAVGNRVFFTASTATTGWNVWVSDGTAAGTMLTKDIVPGMDFFAPYGLTELNGALMFAATTNGGAYHLWRSDGTPEGTALVKEIFVNAFGLPNAKPFANVNGTLFFSGHQNATGWELWKTDGTTDGTQLVKDFHLGNVGVSPGFLTAVNGRVFFAGVVPSTSGMQGQALFVSDGTADGTELLRAWDYPAIVNGANAAGMSTFTDVNGMLYFAAYETVLGPSQLFRSDGTASGTVAVPIPNGGTPAHLTNVNGTLFMSAADTVHGRELWKVGPPTVPAWLNVAPGAAYLLSGSTLTVSAGTVTFTGDASATHPDLNVTVESGASAIFSTSQHLAALQLPGGSASLSAGGGRVLVLGALSITGVGLLETGDNDLIIDYAGDSPYAAIKGYVVVGRNTGASGIVTTSTTDTTLAVADNALFGKTTFNGIPIDATTIIGKYTYFGDANLDGKVTGDDYLSVDAHLGLSGAQWFQGDFNFSSSVTGDDYLAIDANLGKGTLDPLAFAADQEAMIALHAERYGGKSYVKAVEQAARGNYKVGTKRLVGKL